jgi:hypothetical protein
MVHDRVADEHDLPHSFFMAGNHIGDCLPNCFTDDARQLLIAKCMLDAAHDVRSISRLRVQEGSRLLHLAGSKIDRLQDDRCSAQIDSNSQPITAGATSRSLVRQDAGCPLADLDGQWTFRPQMTA